LKKIKIGIELSGIHTSDRARGNYLIAETSKSDTRISSICPSDNVDVRIIMKRGAEVWGRKKKPGEILIFDVSDAILTPPLSYSIAKRLYQRLVINPKYISFLSECNAIVVACRKQQEILSKYGISSLIIPDHSYYHTSFDASKRKIPTERIIFVWDGQGHNFPYLELIIKENIEFFRRSDVLLKVVTDKKNLVNGTDNKEILLSYNINATFVEWNEASFVQEVNAAHVGLAPVDLRCPHAIAKPDNKMVNYQGLALPIIASSTMAYKDYSKKSPGGVIICDSMSDWSDALEFWRLNRDTVIQRGAQGRSYVIENYSAKALTNAWLRVIDSVLNEN